MPFFILDEKNLPEFRKNALERAKEFDSDHIVPKYEAYYRLIMDKCHSFVK